MVGDNVKGLQRLLKDCVGGEKYREMRAGLGPLMGRTVDRVMAAGDDALLLVAICKALLGGARKPEPANGASPMVPWRAAVCGYYDAVIAALFAEAVLARFAEQVVLKPIVPTAYDLAVEDDYGPPLAPSWHAAGPGTPNDLLNALVAALRSDGASGVIALVAKEAASRLGLSEPEALLEERVGLYVSRFVDLAIEAFDLRRQEQGHPSLFRIQPAEVAMTR